MLHAHLLAQFDDLGSSRVTDIAGKHRPILVPSVDGEIVLL